MIELLVWRHAKTEPGNPGTPDRDRELLPVGRADAREMGRVLAEADLVPGLVLSSDATRAVQTAALAMEGFPAGIPRFDLPELYDAEWEDYLSAAATYGGRARRLLLVGHNPTVTELVSRAAGTAMQMKTGFLAVIEAEVADASAAGPGTPLRLRSIMIPERRG